MNWTSAKSLTWICLSDMFRIRRSSLIMPKPVMGSHCKAMCYRKLANCFGRVTEGVDIKAASNVLAMVLPLCLKRSERDGTCLPPVGWNLDDCQGPECWLEGHAPLGLPYSAAWHHIVTLCKFWEWLAVIFRIQSHPQSCRNHWCEVFAKPCAIENWPIVLAEGRPLEAFTQQATF